VRTLTKITFVGGGLLVVVGLWLFLADAIFPEIDWVSGLAAVPGLLWLRFVDGKFDRLWPKPRPGWKS
jgi:hypothetical protein